MDVTRYKSEVLLKACNLLCVIRGIKGPPPWPVLLGPRVRSSAASLLDSLTRLKRAGYWSHGSSIRAPLYRVREKETQARRLSRRVAPWGVWSGHTMSRPGGGEREGRKVWERNAERSSGRLL